MLTNAFKIRALVFAARLNKFLLCANTELFAHFFCCCCVLRGGGLKKKMHSFRCYLSVFLCFLVQALKSTLCCRDGLLVTRKRKAVAAIGNIHGEPFSNEFNVAIELAA